MSRFYKDLRLTDKEISLKLSETIESEQARYSADTYHFHIIRTADQQIVGTISFKVGSNDYLYYAGNIGYEIYPQYRNHHYSLKAALLVVRLAQLHDMQELVITCDKDNDASARICSLLGAGYSGTVSPPVDSQAYRLGIREKKRYILKIQNNRQS